jgi:hypothetical protein
MQGIAQKVLANPGKYSIQELQQGVQDGIIPAYIAIPIIQSKVQDQKQAQMAQAMQQPPAQTRPPVAQQVMSEARGLEALPTNLPSQYAAGGIVAFDEGGEVPRYQVGGQLGSGMYGFVNDPMGTGAEGIMGVAGTANPYVGRNLFERLVGAPEMPEWQKQQAIAQIMKERAAAQPSVAPVATTTQTAPASASAAAPSTGTGLGGTSALGRAPGMGLKPPKFVAPGGDSYESSAKKFYEGYETKAGELDKQTDEAIKQANESVKGKAFEGYKSALEQEALQAGADKDQAKYMSLFKAGLAMMAGTSRHALENIGKGAMVGAEDYQAAVKDLKKAEKERQKEFALIEQAQRAEALGDRDKAVDRLNKAREIQDARLRYTGEGIYKGSNLDRQQAYDLAKTQFSSESDIFRTHLAGQYQMGAAGISADARMAALLASSANRGQMNQKQVGDTLLQLQSSPEANEYRKKLLKEKGERAANTPEFKAAMDNFVGGLFQKYYGNTSRGGTGLGGGLNLGQEDMDLVQQYLRR